MAADRPTDPEEPLLAFTVLHYEGSPVQCERRHWISKIEPNHPELSGREAEIAAAITDPELVLQDRDYPDRRHFIRAGDDGLFLHAVVQYRQAADAVAGRLVTAMVRRRLRAGDQVLFIKRTE